MRCLVMMVVRLYWALIPAARRRPCLFRETCSHFVLRAAREGGFRAAVSALRTRIRQCRPGYVLYTAPDELQYVVLADYTVVPLVELRPDLSGR